MRIAYVMSGFPITFITNEVESHRHAGWDVLPVVSSKPRDTSSLSELEIQWRNRAVYRPPLGGQVLAVLHEMVRHPLRLLCVVWFLVTLAFHTLREFAKAAYEFGPACEFAAHCRRFEAEHVHVHFASRSLSLGLMIGMLIRRPVSVTVHAFDIFTRSRRSLRGRLLRCQFISAISRFNIEYLRKLCGQDVAERCRLVHCGIDVRRFNPEGCDPQPGRMICVAFFVEKKGLDDALVACAKLRDMNVPFLFQLVGDGPRRPQLESLVNELHLQQHVQLLGRKPNDQLMGLLQKATLFLTPCIKDSRGDMDGIPVAMMEALASGVPVVSTVLSGIPELVEDGVTGRLVSPRDTDALAAVLRESLADPVGMREMGRAGRKRVEQEFDQADNAAKLRVHIQECRLNR